MKSRLYNLFPNIRVFAQPPSNHDPYAEENEFWEDLIKKVGSAFIKSIKKPELRNLYKAVFRNDLNTANLLLNNKSLHCSELIRFSDSVDTDEFILPELSPAFLAGWLNRNEILHAFYVVAIKLYPNNKIWWACAFNQYKLLTEINNWDESLLFNCPLIFIASQNGHSEAISALIGAKVNLYQELKLNGATALQIACQMGHLNIVKLLIDAGINIHHLPDRNKFTPLYLASQNGHLEIVNLLVATNADVNQRLSNNSSTALEIACQNGHLNIIHALIRAGSNVTEVNQTTGLTPLEIAQHNEHKEIAQLIKARTKVTCLDEFSVLKLFIDYAAKKQIYLRPKPGFFYSPSGNHYEDLVSEALIEIGSKSLTLEEFLGRLKYISVREQSSLLYYCPDELSGFIKLAECLLKKTFAAIRPSIPQHPSHSMLHTSMVCMQHSF